jgi:hypothetical protein
MSPLYRSELPIASCSTVAEFGGLVHEPNWTVKMIKRSTDHGTVTVVVTCQIHQKRRSSSPNKCYHAVVVRTLPSLEYDGHMDSQTPFVRVAGVHARPGIRGTHGG